MCVDVGKGICSVLVRSASPKPLPTPRSHFGSLLTAISVAQRGFPGSWNRSSFIVLSFQSMSLVTDTVYESLGYHHHLTDFLTVLKILASSVRCSPSRICISPPLLERGYCPIMEKCLYFPCSFTHTLRVQAQIWGCFLPP